MSPTTRRTLLTLLLSLLLSACSGLRQPVAPPPVVKQPAAMLAFEQGVRTYEDGRYEVAALWLDEALRLGLEPASAVRAHKLRAFIECIAARVDSCKTHFREVIKLDPRFELIRAEAGHPMWGPVFREVRAEIPPR